MHLPGPLPRQQRQPSPSNFRSSPTRFSTAAPRLNRGAAFCHLAVALDFRVFLNLTSIAVSVSWRRAPSRGSAPAGPGPHSSRSTSRSRRRFAGSSHGTVTSRRPGGSSSLTRADVCELRRRLLLLHSASSPPSCCFLPKPLLEFDFNRAG